MIDYRQPAVLRSRYSQSLQSRIDAAVRCRAQTVDLSVFCKIFKKRLWRSAAVRQIFHSRLSVRSETAHIQTVLCHCRTTDTYVSLISNLPFLRCRIGAENRTTRSLLCCTSLLRSILFRLCLHIFIRTCFNLLADLRQAVFSLFLKIDQLQQLLIRKLLLRQKKGTPLRIKSHAFLVFLGAVNQRKLLLRKIPLLQVCLPKFLQSRRLALCHWSAVSIRRDICLLQLGKILLQFFMIHVFHPRLIHSGCRHRSRSQHQTGCRQDRRPPEAVMVSAASAVFLQML